MNDISLSLYSIYIYIPIYIFQLQTVLSEMSSPLREIVKYNFLIAHVLHISELKFHTDRKYKYFICFYKLYIKYFNFHKFVALGNYK